MYEKLKTAETAKELDEKFKESFNESLSKAFAEYRESGSFTVDSLEDNSMELAFAKGYLAGFIDLEKKMMANVLDELKKFNGAGAYVTRGINYTELYQDINYAELYGVHPGEKDFTGAIERSLKKGKQHFGPEMYKLIKDIQICRHNAKK